MRGSQWESRKFLMDGRCTGMRTGTGTHGEHTERTASKSETQRIQKKLWKRTFLFFCTSEIHFYLPLYISYFLSGNSNKIGKWIQVISFQKTFFIFSFLFFNWRRKNIKRLNALEFYHFLSVNKLHKIIKKIATNHWFMAI